MRNGEIQINGINIELDVLPGDPIEIYYGEFSMANDTSEEVEVKIEKVVLHLAAEQMVQDRFNTYQLPDFEPVRGGMVIPPQSKRSFRITFPVYKLNQAPRLDEMISVSADFRSKGISQSSTSRISMNLELD